MLKGQNTLQLAYQLAKANQSKSRVLTRYIPEGSGYDFARMMPLLEYPALEKNVAKLTTAQRHIAKNQLHYVLLCEFLLFRLYSQAQKAAPLEKQHYEELKSLANHSLKSKPIPFNPFDAKTMNYAKGIVPLDGFAALSQKAGPWQLLEFMNAMEGEMERAWGDFQSLDGGRLARRMQPEHVLAHAVLFVSFYERELHYQQLRLASETMSAVKK